jgi:hypothetical protein
MNAFEIDTTIGPDAKLALERLPFVSGQAVHVRIETKVAPTAGPRILGLHVGAVQMADDFDAPLPDTFWLGTDRGHEASA